MQIITDASKKEIKTHGTPMFPLLIKHEKISAYDSGSFTWHWHPEIELTLITGGDMLYSINHSTYHVHSGDALFGNANTMHTGSRFQDHECTYTSITFQAVLLAKEGSSLYRKYVQPLVNDLSLSSLYMDQSEPWHQDIIAAMQTITILYANKEDTFEMDLLIELYRIWKQLHLHLHTNLTISSFDRQNYERIKTILRFLENHYAEDITLQTIANQIHVCKNECCRIFKHYMHQSLFAFLIEYRIEKSIPLLFDEAYAISEISSLCGFHDSNYFSRVFKKQKGCSPLQYRKAYNENKAVKKL